MTAATPVPLSTASQAAFIAYYRSVQNNANINRVNQRSRLETIDRLYQRELDLSQEQQQAQQANLSGDPTRYQNMTVPIVMPQVEAAVTYQTSVFLTGDPLFGVVAGPEYADEALALQTVLEENSLRGGWARELILFFRDGFKYNFGVLEIDWCNEVTAVFDTDLTKSLVQGIPKEVLWSGNKVTRRDPYNTFVDNRVAPTEVYRKGEFAGFTELMGRIELKSYLATLPDKIISNVIPAFESASGITPSGVNSDPSAYSFYIPDINPIVDEDNRMGTGTNWMAWAGLSSNRKNIEYKDIYEVTTLYARILPSEFSLKVPSSNTPQIYKLKIINHQVIVYCELQTNAHQMLPILIGQPLEDGLDYQTKSLAENGAPFQLLATAYMNSIIASRRRAISDRTLYDPSRIAAAHINSSNPSAKIPVRPSAYGSDISQAVYQFPYREDQASNSMQQISALVSMANSLNGQNLAQQGQFVKGNKTLSEYEDVMQNANGRDQLVSILLEYQVFTPMKEMLKINVLQYQGGTSLYNRDKKVVVEVDPIALRKAVLNFRVSDGLIPTDKIIGAESFSVALQVLGSSPSIAAQYNLGELFSYMMKTQGADISAFEKSPEQSAYEQAVSAWQQMAQFALEKGYDPATTLPPMPLPEQYGYNPEDIKPAPPGTNQPQTPQQTMTGLS